MRHYQFFARTICASTFAALLFSATAMADGLIPNASLETDANLDQWPDQWPKLKAGGTWNEEGGNHFIRITSEKPGEMYMLYREINIPEGVKELTLTWRQRVSNLELGEQKWFDARIMMEWMDAGRSKIAGKPPEPKCSKDTQGWEEKSLTFVVPDGARILKFMPSLFRVKSGKFDLDDVQLTPKTTP
jgi:endoglucanase